MASISVHFTNKHEAPKADVRALTTCGDTLVLNLRALGEDHISLFFDNENALADFVNSIQTAFTAHLQSTEGK